MAGGGFDFNALSHPARASLSEEMHVRKFPTFAPPARLMQIVMLCGEGTFAASLEQVRALCAPFGVEVAEGRKYFTCQLGGLGFAWERHTESSPRRSSPPRVVAACSAPRRFRRSRTIGCRRCPPRRSARP